LKKTIAVFAGLLLVAAFSLTACQKKEEAKAPGYGTQKETAAGYGQKAKEAAAGYGQKPKEAAAGYGQKAKEAVQGYGQKPQQAVPGYGKQK